MIQEHRDHIKYDTDCIVLKKCKLAVSHSAHATSSLSLQLVLGLTQVSDAWLVFCPHCNPREKTQLMQATKLFQQANFALFDFHTVISDTHGNCFTHILYDWWLVLNLLHVFHVSRLTENLLKVLELLMKCLNI